MSSKAVNDDMIVLVVDEKGHSKEYPLDAVTTSPIILNVESLVDSSNFKETTSELHEYSSHSDDNYEAEYLEEDYIKELEDEEEKSDTDYVGDGDEPLEYSDEEYNITPKNKDAPRRSLKRKVVSFVDEVCKEYPHLAKDSEQLIEHLADIMRQTKPPEPPPNFYKETYRGGMKQFQCSFCEKKTETVMWAIRHYQSMHGEFYLNCFACGVEYRNNLNLYKHERRCRGPGAALMLEARKQALGRQGRGRPKKAFNKVDTANSTKKEKVRLFCSKCPATFTQGDSLKAHENSHLGLRPYRCTQCTACFASAIKLNRHLKIQHSDQKFICDVCGAEFKEKSSLISHLNRHRDVPKYACEHCPVRFAMKTALITHTNKVHLNLPAPHACLVCPKRYSRIRTAREHMRLKHGLTLITHLMYSRAMTAMENQVMQTGTEDTDPESVEVVNNNKELKTEEIVINNTEPNTKQTIKPKSGEDEADEVNDLLKNIPYLKEYIELDLRDNAREKGSFISHVTIEDKDGIKSNTLEKDYKNGKDKKQSEDPARNTKKEIKTETETDVGEQIDDSFNNDYNNSKIKMKEEKVKNELGTTATEVNVEKQIINDCNKIITRKSKRGQIKKAIPKPATSTTVSVVVEDINADSDKIMITRNKLSRKITKPAKFKDIDSGFDKIMSMRSKREHIKKVSFKQAAVTEDVEELDDEFNQHIVMNKKSIQSLQKKTSTKTETTTTITEFVEEIDDESDKINDFKSKQTPHKKVRNKPKLTTVPEVVKHADDEFDDYIPTNNLTKVNEKKGSQNEQKEAGNRAHLKRKHSENNPSKVAEATKAKINQDDVKDWKNYRKHVVVEEFLDYVQSRKVPTRLSKTIPILRKKSKLDLPSEIETSEWLKKIRDEYKPEEDEDCTVVDVTEVVQDTGNASSKRLKRNKKCEKIEKVPFVKIEHKKK